MNSSSSTSLNVVVAGGDDAVVRAQALEHFDLARVLPAEPHRRAARRAPVLGDQVDPAAARVLQEAAALDDQALRRTRRS